MATEHEQAPLRRVRELEAMVQKLTVENEKLMTRVQSPSSQQDETEVEKSPPNYHQSAGKQLRACDEEESSDDDVIALSDLDETGEDEWLFVSPIKPPTPQQKRVTPTEWLSGETSRSITERNLPSLNEVRKTLASTMDEAEQFAKSPVLNNTKRKMQPTNKTAQKYLNRVRERRQSPTGSEGSSPGSLSPVEPQSHSPLLHKKQRNVPVRPVIPRGSQSSLAERAPQNHTAASSLKVNWTPPKAGTYQEDEFQEEPARQPVDASLKVRWDPSKAVVSDDEEELEAEQQESLKVNWKARMPVEDRGGREASQMNPLKVNWKARMPAEDEEEKSMQENSLKVNWKARMPAEEESTQVNSLKVNWKVRMPVEDEEEYEEEQELKQPNPLKVKWTVRVPVDDDEKEESVPVVKWNPKQVPDEPLVQQTEGAIAEEIPKTRWNVRNVSDPSFSPDQGRNQQRQSPDITTTQSLKASWTPRRPQGVANPLKMHWDPRKASPASSEEDLASQKSEDSSSSPPLQHVSRYSAHVSKLAQPQTTPPAAATTSGLQGRRTYAAKPVASVSPLQKGIASVSPGQRGSGLRQPSPARSGIPGASPPTRQLPSPGQGQAYSSARSRSLSPDQRPEDDAQQNVQRRQPSSSFTSNDPSTSPQTRLRTPGTASLGRKSGLKVIKPLTASSGRAAQKPGTTRPSIVPQQGYANPRQPSTTSRQLPSPQQQRKIVPVGQAKPRSGSGIRQPSSLRKSAARGSAAQTTPTQTGSQEWLDDCF